MEQTVKSITRILLWGLLCAAVMILIPWGVDVCLGGGTLFGNADYLGYYGALVSTITSILVLVKTISFTRHQIQYEQHNQNEREKWKGIDDQFVTAIASAHPLLLDSLLIERVKDLTEHEEVAAGMGIYPELRTLINTAKINRDNFRNSLAEEEKEKLDEPLQLLNELIDQLDQQKDACVNILREFVQANKNYRAAGTEEAVAELQRQYREIGKRQTELRQLGDGMYYELMAKKRACFDKIYGEINVEAEQILKTGHISDTRKC